MWQSPPVNAFVRRPGGISVRQSKIVFRYKYVLTRHDVGTMCSDTVPTQSPPSPHLSPHHSPHLSPHLFFGGNSVILILKERTDDVVFFLLINEIVAIPSKK